LRPALSVMRISLERSSCPAVAAARDVAAARPLARPLWLERWRAAWHRPYTLAVTRSPYDRCPGVGLARLALGEVRDQSLRARGGRHQVLAEVAAGLAVLVTAGLHVPGWLILLADAGAAAYALSRSGPPVTGTAGWPARRARPGRRRDLPPGPPGHRGSLVCRGCDIAVCATTRQRPGHIVILAGRARAPAYRRP
jgi:hypothetical protein